jgi:hypothetical protein
MKTILIEQLVLCSSKFDAELKANLLYVLKYATKTFYYNANEDAQLCSHHHTA